MVDETNLCNEKYKCISQVNSDLLDRLNRSEEFIKSIKEQFKKSVTCANAEKNSIANQIPKTDKSGIGNESDKTKKKKQEKGKQIPSDSL